jgi:transcription initiation factor TFIIIB Brf1 subunit/transcription initiation factor TFIIB
MKMNIYKMRECPDCGSDNIYIVEENQQLICRDCGMIYESLPDDLESDFEESHEMVLGIDRKVSQAIKNKSKASKPKKKKK